MGDSENTQKRCRLCGTEKNQLKYLFDADHIGILSKLRTTFSILVSKKQLFN